MLPADADNPDNLRKYYAAAKGLIFDVDVKGGLALKNYYKERALTVFVKVPKLDILEERLRSRGTETEESLSKRIFKMKFEWAFQDKFDVILVNDVLEIAVQEAQCLFDKLTQ
jgi:guanylate kinase